MRIPSNSLGVFVPGYFTIPENPFFPGMAGLGDNPTPNPAGPKIVFSPTGVQVTRACPRGYFEYEGMCLPVTTKWSPNMSGMGANPTPTGNRGVTFSSTGATVTRGCPRGYYQYKNTCLPVGTGWSPNVSGMGANPTPTGSRGVTFSPTGATVTRGCPRGYYQYQNTCLPLGTGWSPNVSGLREFVPAQFTLPPQPALGDFVGTGSMYPITPNSVTAAAGMGDCGCGCGGTCGCGGLHGISDDFSSMFSNMTSGNWSGAWSSFMTMLQEPVFGTVPLWMVAGSGLLVYAFFFSGGVHSRYQRGRRASKAARSAYA